MTGQYASRCTTERFMKMCPSGTPSNVGFNVQVEPGVWNVARVLRDHGYRTGFVGKWHTGAPPLLSIPADANLHDPDVAGKLAENQRRLCDYIKRAGFDYAASVYRGNLARTLPCRRSLDSTSVASGSTPAVRLVTRTSALKSTASKRTTLMVNTDPTS
jgi:hypothetical protein